ncbi:MAG: YjcQ family protein [Lentihominibacter sp.]
MLEHDSRLININEKYWVYVIENMQEQGYIKNAVLTFAWGNVLAEANLSKVQITPAGIEYLCENSTIKRAYRFLKETKGIVPFELF